MSLLRELSESRLYPTESKLDKEKHETLTNNIYMIIMALHILLCEESTQEWAEKYVKKTLRGDYTTWRTDATDLYAIMYALNSGKYHEGTYKTFSLGSTKRWLRNVSDMEHAESTITRVFFMRMDGVFHMKDSVKKSIRRKIMDWVELDNKDRRVTFTRLLNLFRNKLPKAEVLVKLEILARSRDYELEEAVNMETGEVASKYSIIPSLKETASAGATGASSVATVATALGANSLGAGFDTNGHKGIYQNAPLVLRRGSPPKKNLTESPLILQQEGMGLTTWYNDDVIITGGSRSHLVPPIGYARLMYILLDRKKFDETKDLDQAKQGDIELFVGRDHDLCGLINIKLDTKNRRAGMGRMAVQSLVDTAKHDFSIVDIKKSAIGFWKKMGCEFYTDRGVPVTDFKKWSGTGVLNGVIRTGQRLELNQMPGFSKNAGVPSGTE